MAKPAILIGIGSAKKPMGDPMGKPKSPPEPSAEDDVSEFDAAIAEAVDAISSGDTTTAKEALGAAIAAKVAQMTSTSAEGEEEA